MVLFVSKNRHASCQRECLSEGENSCEQAVAYKILPGASLVLELEAARYEAPSCQQEDGTDDAICTVRQPLIEGSYFFQVSWYPALNDENADCSPETDTAACSILGIAGAGDRSLETVAVEYPTDGPVVLTIE